MNRKCDRQHGSGFFSSFAPLHETEQVGNGIQNQGHGLTKGVRRSESELREGSDSNT